MQAKKLEVSDLNALKKDASQMIEDLTDLSRKLAKVGKEGTEEISRDLKDKFETELVSMRTRIDALNRECQKLAKQVDQSVRDKPYYYMAGALGLGLLLGKLLLPSRSP